MSLTSIFVAGEAPVDVLIYPEASISLANDTHNNQMLRTHRYRGGTALIFRLLQVVENKHNLKLHDVSRSGHDQENIRQESVRSILEFEIYGQGNFNHDHFTLKIRNIQRLHYQPSSENLINMNNSHRTDVLILHEAVGQFKNSKEAITSLRKARPGYIVYNMTRPLASGKIWDTIRNGPYVADDEQKLEKLIVVVSANDLRAEGIQLSHGLSWEKTCEDFVEQLGSVSTLVTLVTCAHLIVVFGCDGVIYHRGRQVAQPTLFFDPRCMEGDFAKQNIGIVPGLNETFVAALALKLVSSEGNLEECIELALSAVRRLASRGLNLDIKTLDTPQPKYPLHEIMDDLSADENILKFSIPSNIIGSGVDQNWSILDHTIGDPTEVARSIVKNGIKSSSITIPLAQFNHLVLVDRHEIESFRTIANVLHEYIDVPQTKPISIALFGTRGSGKSFAAMQVGKTVLSGRKISQFHLDLAQFTGPSDLINAFHSIRDSNLESSFPLVYINGFDVPVSGSHPLWLSHLLAPILQGQFLDHGKSRPIGPAIFFLGGTKYRSYRDFRNNIAGGTKGVPSASVEEFLGCLHGVVDMLGPDCINENDRLYLVRRAIILRALLEEREPMLKINEKISIDENVLDGLLMVPSYRQGIKSLKSIIAMSKLNGCRHFEKAALPPATQLDLHVDYKTFAKCLSGPMLPE